MLLKSYASQMILSFNQQEYPFSSEVPVDLTRYLVTGYTGNVVINAYAKLLLQEYNATGSRILYSVLLADKKVNITVQDQKPLLIAYLPLQHDRILDIPHLGKLPLKEGQFNIFYTPNFPVISNYDSAKEHLTLAIHYDQQMLQDWAPFFPALGTFLNKIQSGEPAQLLDHPEWQTKEIQDIIYKLLHPVHDSSIQKVYLDLLVKTLLFHLLYQSVQQRPASNYSHYEVEGIQAAGEMIRKNLRYHFVIREIAQKVGMNEFKLKNGFRELFGNGVYEYLRTERMHEARSLLTDKGRSIKEIAALTGYRSVNSFIKAFKKKFNQTPGDFRKNPK